MVEPGSDGLGIPPLGERELIALDPSFAQCRWNSNWGADAVHTHNVGVTLCRSRSSLNDGSDERACSLSDGPSFTFRLRCSPSRSRSSPTPKRGGAQFFADPHEDCGLFVYEGAEEGGPNQTGISLCALASERPRPSLGAG